jgi:hypothetical protein
MSCFCDLFLWISMFISTEMKQLRARIDSARKGGFRCQNGANKIPETINIESKGCQHGSRNETRIIKGNPRGQGAKKEPKRERPWDEMGAIFDQSR